jgi:hypothetical protein
VKKQKYQVSSIATVIELSEYANDDWVKEDIEKREVDFKNTIIKYFRENLAINN